MNGCGRKWALNRHAGLDPAPAFIFRRLSNGRQTPDHVRGDDGESALRKILLAAAAAMAVTPACAQPAAQAGAPPGAPKLIVALSIDQLSGDLYDEYRPRLQGGFARLSSGTVFRNGYQSHNATETCPGHSTILTGSRPARTGIIANNWFNLGLLREDKGVYCSEDPRVPGSSSKGGQYTVSPYHLRVPALGDHMKRANPASRVAVVSGKDRAAIMMGGYRPDQRWWWDHDAKAFVNPGVPATPRAVAAANEGVKEALSRARAARDLPRLCEPHSRAIPVVVITAKNLTPEEQERLNNSVEKVLRKGYYTQAELLAEVQHLVKEIKR